jgi:hypothetical protein
MNLEARRAVKAFEKSLGLRPRWHAASLRRRA